ncbi:TetR/AcrR family transcriptional regulator [Curtobacterium sp. Leaf261]|uniref:TetR/AcrR family transcriptional regulator n=1 Tax=Curtobacterium sp. Leaf261 TaxID=1736311 RepID=UPI000700DEBB|nr:TetR/AcrR family transcriptional regulator [Curtobacterium sp. Leaf261]KQO64535.1 TetR family transcriptional regulator [Curtobacterium sp. Leaf261]
MSDTATGPGASRDDVRARIVDAAMRLLHERGPAAVTTRGVAVAAGIQAPTIYRLFGDKDGLLDAVAEHVMATYVTAKAAIVARATVEDVDPLDDLRAGWHAQIDFGITNPTLFRLLSDPARVVASPAAQSGRDVLVARVHRLARAGRLRVGEDRAVDLLQAAGIGAIQMLLATTPARRDDRLADSMFAAVLGQVLVDPPASPFDAHPGPDARTRATVAFRAVVPELETLSTAERALLVDWLDRELADRPAID